MNTNNLKRTVLRIGLLIVIIANSFLLTSCATYDDVYDVASQYEATDEELQALSEGKLTATINRGDFDSNLDYYKYLLYYYTSYGTNILKNYAIFIIVVSLAIGVLIFIFSPKSIQLRKIAVFIFILGIPIFTILCIYGSAILADSFS